MTSEKSTVAHGVFPNKTELTKFLGTFKEITISQHQSQKMTVETKGKKRVITLYIKDYADFLIRSSLRDGMLSRWKELFKLDGPRLI